MNILEHMFTEAMKNGLDICVEVTIPGQKDTEFIVNRNSSLDNKLAYYKKNYNSELIHNSCPDIKIISVKQIKIGH